MANGERGRADGEAADRLTGFDPRRPLTTENMPRGRGHRVRLAVPATNRAAEDDDAWDERATDARGGAGGVQRAAGALGPWDDHRSRRVRIRR